jgi:hypothetical protein
MSTTTGHRPLKRGALPTPAHILAGATPHTAVGGPPNFIRMPPRLSMWGNDVHGDCVTAEEAFAKACHSPEIFISDQEVIQWATQNGVLEGAYLHDVLTWMLTKGFNQSHHVYDDGHAYSLNWTNNAVLCNAIYQGPVKLGIGANQLENTWHQANGHNGWFATAYQHEATEDHCVSLCGYGSMTWLASQLKVHVPPNVNGAHPGYAMFTWDSIGIIDVASMIAITHEAWVRLPTTIVH